MPDHAGHKIYYARIKTAGQNYSFSETNQKIANLKKLPSVQDPNQLYYKGLAIEQFAREATEIFAANADKKIEIVPMPPSKIPGHPDYDDRLLKVAQKIVAACPHAKVFPALVGVENRAAAHAVTETRITRSVQGIYDNLKVDQTILTQHDPDAKIVLLDDVITSGASIAAAIRHLKEVIPDCEPSVVAWAKAAYPTITIITPEQTV